MDSYYIDDPLASPVLSPVPPHPEDHRVNILLVDDRPENLLALRSVLEDLGQNLVEAQSGREALKHLLQDDFAAILMDVQMPEMDGFETALLIRARSRSQHTPIIFLTAINKGDQYVSRGYSIGAVDYVFKPFVPEILKAKVSAFVEMAKKTMQLEDEIAQRLRAEEKIKRLNKDLERRVRERTAELEGAVNRLQAEIIERKQLEQALQQRAEALADADRRKDEFLAMLGHELRNPLAPILNALHVMRQRGADNSTLERAREIVERQVRHIARLIDDLLDVSRITQGKIDLREETVNLSQVIELALEAALPLIEEGGHHLTVEAPEEVVWLRADGVRLQQVFSNLLNNAAKYTGPGGEIGFIVTVEEGEAVVCVRDSGFGILPEMLPHVFDLFTQADRSLDRSQGGLGIGLTMVKNLVQMHGGSVEARSEGRGMGSEFIVRLPVLSVQPPSAETEGMDWRARDALPYHAEAFCRVLVIEDNQDAADSLCDILRLLDYEVEWADSGTAGIEMAERFLPQVILCDIGLPEMDGYVVAKTLRQNPALKGVIMIALSGYGQKEDQRLAREAGFDLHLVKPVDPERLQQLLVSSDLRDRCSIPK